MRFTFVGDIALGDHPKAVGFGFRSRYLTGIAPELAARIVPPDGAPDFFFGNLEFPLGFSPADEGDVARAQCRGLDAYVHALAAAGITALNVATNHSSQHGGAVFRRTVEGLRNAGIHVVGTPDDFGERGILHVGGRRLALLGWSDRPRQYSPERPPYNELSDDALEHIANARRRADLVVASVHWGDEFILVPSDRERATARAMIDAGATFVIGHHPHVLREVESYRHGVIAYSLGNFIGDMTWDPRNRLSGWLNARLGEDGNIASWQVISALVDDDYFPRLLGGAADTRVVDRIESARREHAGRVAREGYGRVAEEERKRHARRTALMMLRNMHRYPKGAALSLFAGALSNRLRAVVSASPASESSLGPEGSRPT